MRALTWQGKREVEVREVPDPVIQEPTDAIVRITTTAICGSDLHLYEVLGAYLNPGDVLGHEAMGVVEEVGSEVTHIAPGRPRRRAVQHLLRPMLDVLSAASSPSARRPRCATRARARRCSATPRSTARCPAARREYLRVPAGPLRADQGARTRDRTSRFLYLSDILPTAWQAVAYADVPPGGTLAVLGLGPVGQFATRIARAPGVERVIGVDLVPERLELAEQHGSRSWTSGDVDDVAATLLEMTGGRGPDAVIDAVGMEAHGSPRGKAAQTAVGLLPDALARPLIDRFAVDRLDALHTAIKSVRRGGTVSVSGVYGGEADPMPMMEMFDRGMQLRMGQCHVKRWIDDIMPLVLDETDPLGTSDLATHLLPLEQAPHGYEIFQAKQDACIKVLLNP